MSNGWTGGQYSHFRVVFGLYLFLHFVDLLPWGAEVFSSRGALPDVSASPLIHLFPNILALWDALIFVQVLLALGALLSLLFIVGQFDRAAGLGLWYLLACLFGRNPLIANPSLPYIGWLLLAHAFVPPAPYGSWAARGRADAAGGWKMPKEIFLLAWLLMALGYTYSGYMKLISPSWVDGTALSRVLENPLARPGWVREMMRVMPEGLLQIATWSALGFELLFAPLALFRPLRPWLWLGMILMHLGLVTMLSFADLTFRMVILHLFTFDPEWIPGRKVAALAVLFYDGHCGLCHRVVRFVVAEDRTGEMVQFAPLQGELFQRMLADVEGGTLPDTLVLRTADGALLTRSATVLDVMKRLGGLWRLIAGIASLVPVSLLDAAYDGVARVRYKLFKQPQDLCPLMPPHLHSRFHM